MSSGSNAPSPQIPGVDLLEVERLDVQHEPAHARLGEQERVAAQPGQVAAVSHGCPTALFRGIRVLNTSEEGA